MPSKKPKTKADVTPSRARFGQKLVSTRVARGYKTAYGFFYNSGGEDKFDFSYHHYLLMEKGMRLPSREALGQILSALGGVTSHAEERQLLLELYLKALLDGDSLFNPLFEKLKAKPQRSPDYEPDIKEVHDELVSTVAKQAVSDVPRATARQAEELYREPEGFWVHQYLLQSGNKYKAEELAAILSYPVETVAPALERLVAAKLVERRKDGLCFSPNFETDLFLPTESLRRDHYGWISEQVMQRVNEGDRELFHGSFFLALEDLDRMKSIISLARDLTRKAYLYRPKRSVPRGQFVGVECRISPLAKIGDDSQG